MQNNNQPISSDNVGPDPAVPASYPRRILLAVTGLSPQIVTETLYALAVNPTQNRTRYVPTEVHLITTQPGVREAQLNLLAQKDGWFHKLIKDYQLPAIDFSLDNIHVLKDVQGTPLDDIRTPSENEQAADFITEHVRHLTEDEQSALHVSIAGGRKTMGYYLGYALSLYGRNQDRLSHVLVSEPYESHRDFFYPTPYEHKIHVQRGTLEGTYNASKAEVELAEIPFVSLRHGLPDNLLTGRSGFTATVHAAQQSLGPSALVIDQHNKRVRCGNTVITLPPAELALYSLFARRAQKRQPAIPAPTKDAPDSEWAATFLEEYRRIRGEMGDTDKTEHALQEGMDGDYFSMRKTNLHKKLKDQLGPAAKNYLIDDGNRRPRRYSLPLPADAIQFATIDEDDQHEPHTGTKRRAP